jgi:hypothetical protein
MGHMIMGDGKMKDAIRRIVPPTTGERRTSTVYGQNFLRAHTRKLVVVCYGLLAPFLKKKIVIMGVRATSLI